MRLKYVTIHVSIKLKGLGHDISGDPVYFR